MSNIVDYLDWRGDITLAEREFNDIDNLVFSQIVYLDMDGIEGVESKEGISLSLFWERYRQKAEESSGKNNDSRPLAQRMAASARFRDVKICLYESTTDPESEVQFAAATYLLPDGTAYVAFRGTDSSLAGWKEDFNMTFMAETPGQTASVEYLRKVAEAIPNPLRLGGHSKGGNFAEFAAIYAEKEVLENRILAIYNNDGPGFRAAVMNSDAYTRTLPKVKKIVPESSVIGLLLGGKETMTIVASEVKGARQHYLLTWEVKGEQLVESENRTAYSRFFDEALDGWAAKLDENERRILVDTMYEVLQASGASTIREINAKKISNYTAIVKALRKLDPLVARELMDSLKKFAVSGGVALRNEASDAIMSKIRRGNTNEDLS